MTTFNGARQFGRGGVNAGRGDNPHAREFESLVRRSSTHGGRVLTNRERSAYYVVGPSGRRWGSFDRPMGLTRGGDLSPITNRSNDALFDVTEEYTNQTD